MDPIAFFQSMPEKAAIYAGLAVCLASVLGLTLYVRHKFARARGALDTLTREWTDAENRFFSIADVARSRIDDARPAAAGDKAAAAPPPELGTDTRSQIVSMGKRGMTAAQIASTSGLPEAEVEVLVAMHRIAGRKNA